MCVTICGRFCPIKGGVAGYANRKRAKYTAKWGVQIAGMIFQTGFRACCCEQENSNALFAQLARVFWQVAFGIAQPAFYLVELS